MHILVDRLSQLLALATVSLGTACGAGEERAPVVDDVPHTTCDALYQRGCLLDVEIKLDEAAFHVMCFDVKFSRGVFATSPLASQPPAARLAAVWGDHVLVIFAMVLRSVSALNGLSRQQLGTLSKNF